MKFQIKKTKIKMISIDTFFVDGQWGGGKIDPPRPLPRPLIPTKKSEICKSLIKL